MLFFFYGSLMRGEANHGLVAGRAHFLGEDRVAGTLHDLGEYPGARPGSGGMIRGELFESADPALVADLDAFEGPEYPRIEVRTVGGRTAWFYACEDEGPEIAGGHWPSHRARRG